MSEKEIKDINKEAYKQAEKELLEQQIKKVKGYIYETLTRLEEKKKEKEKVEEEIRILKLDLEDLRNGRFEKIEERIEKSKLAKSISVNPIRITYTNTVNSAYNPQWLTYTSGTYTLPDGKIIYY